MKGQSAIEFISVYGFMLIIAALFIALIVLFAFSAQNSIKTSQCNSFSGFYCASAQIVSNVVAHNSIAFFALYTQQGVPVNVIGMNVIINNGIYPGTCSPSLSLPTKNINCTADLNYFVRVGSQVTGSYTLNARYCNSPLYNVSTNQCIYQNVSYTGSFSTFAVSHIGIGYENTVIPASVVGSISGFEFPQSVSIAPSGTYAYVADEWGGPNFFGYLSIISTSTNTITGTIDSGINNPIGVDIAPSGTYAYVANQRFFNWPLNVVILNTLTGTTVGTVNIGSYLPTVAEISPSGTYAYMTAFTNYNKILVASTASNQITSTLNGPGFDYPKGVAFSPSGTYAYVTQQLVSNIVIVNTATGAVTGSITSAMLSNPGSVAISPDGKYLYIANTGSDQVLIASTATNTIVSSISSGFSGPVGIAFAPDGSFLYVVNAYSNNVVIINPGTYK